jgi:hypothetical protein
MCGLEKDVRCAFFNRDLRSMRAIEFHAFAPLEALKLLHACGQWHFSRVATPLTG